MTNEEPRREKDLFPSLMGGLPIGQNWEKILKNGKTRIRYYVAKGSVRGRCSHRHRSWLAAQKCCDRDQRGCERQGGYSDRRVVEVEL